MEKKITTTSGVEITITNNGVVLEKNSNGNILLSLADIPEFVQGLMLLGIVPTVKTISRVRENKYKGKTISCNVYLPVSCAGKRVAVVEF